MTEATDSIIHILESHEAPEGGWDMPALRRLTGLSIAAFAAAVSRLRSQGRMLAFELALAPGEGQAVAVPAAVPTLAEQVASEAREAGDNRKASRAIGGLSASKVHVSAGAILQERALTDAPALAASIMKDRWGPVWDRVCRHAHATNQRPIAAMISLLDKGLKAEIAA